MRRTVEFWEDFDGSDAPRAIQGGGGAGSRRVSVRNVSVWAARLWAKIQNEQGETVRVVVREAKR